MKVRIAEKAARVACAAAMAVACVPLCSQPAHAASAGAGSSFNVDNLTYTVTAGFNVQLTGVVNPAALSSVLNIPSSVTYGGDAYKLVGIGASALSNCKKLVDVRIPDLNDGVVYGTTFAGCTGLKTIHMLGGGKFTNPGYSEVTDFDGVESLNLVYHTQSFDFDTAGDYNPNTVSFPKDTTAYYAIDFVQDSEKQSVYVAGLTWDGEDAQTVSTPQTLTQPDQAKVYCDAAEGSESLCGIAAVPTLRSGNDSWVVTTASGEVLGATDAINSAGTAQAASSKNVAFAQLSVDNLYTNGKPQIPQVEVISASGTVLEEGVDYRLTYFIDGKQVDSITVGESYPLVDYDDRSTESYVYADTFTVKVSGIGSYSGSCEGSAYLYEPSAKWTRATGTDRYSAIGTVASQGSVIYNTAYTDLNGITGNYGYNAAPSKVHRAELVSGYVYNTSRIVVNPDDWASCMIGASLAGLFGSTIVAVPSDLDESGELSSVAKVQLTTARTGVGLVVGSESSISNKVRAAVSERMNGGASRVTGAAQTPAAMAIAAYNFIRDVESGTYSMTLPASYYTYKSCAVVIPATESASAFSAASWAYANQAPVFFCNDDGTLDDATKEALEGVDPKTGERYFNSVLMPSASATMVTNASAALTGVEVTAWEAGSDECATSASYNDAAIEAGALNHVVTVVAPPSNDWGRLCAAACTAGAYCGVLTLLDFSNDPQGSLDAVKDFAYQVSYGVIAATYDEVPQARMEEVERLWDLNSRGADYSNLRLGEVTVANSQLQYTGEAQVPQITVTNAAGATLSEGKSNDYTVSYINNATGTAISASEIIEPGTYTVTVTGTYYEVEVGWRGENLFEKYGVYINSRSASFEIVGQTPEPVVEKPGKAAVKTLTVGKKQLKVVWGKVTGATKYQLAYRIKGSKAWQSTSVKATKLSIKKLTSGKKYQVRLRAGNASGWGNWSAIKLSAKVK